MQSSLWHWLQPITNLNVITSSNSPDQRLTRIASVLNWFPEDSEELFDMENAKTSQAYPSLPLIHGMMLRLSPGKTHIHTQVCSELSISLSWVSLWALVSCESSFRLCQAVLCIYTWADWATSRVWWLSVRWTDRGVLVYETVQPSGIYNMHCTSFINPNLGSKKHYSFKI